MKYTNKMILVPHEFVNRDSKQDAEKTGITKQVDDFRNELKRILNNDSLSAEEQVQLYSQIFSRYITLDDEDKKPPVVFLKSENTLKDEANMPKNVDSNNSNTERVKRESDVWFSKSVLEGLPQGKRKKAQLLVDLIKNSVEINVERNGQISINNRSVPNTHIVDLIHDFIRDRPNADPAEGHIIFARALKKLNVPKEYIGNQNRWKLINKAQDEDYKTGQESEDSFYDPTATGEGSLLKNVRKRLTYSDNEKNAKKNSRKTYKYESF